MFGELLSENWWQKMFDKWLDSAIRVLQYTLSKILDGFIRQIMPNFPALRYMVSQLLCQLCVYLKLTAHMLNCV